jgi:hypothetical protein
MDFIQRRSEVPNALAFLIKTRSDWTGDVESLYINVEVQANHGT